MKYKLISALVLSAIALSCNDVRASADIESHAKKAPAKVVVLKLSDLQSAYLVRAGVVRYDDHATATDQLRRHFDTVLGLLLYSTRPSIEVALERLELSRDENWSVDERTVWRQRLLEHRYQQIQRLARYRDRALFPLNEGQASHPVPIFVDNHGTACAVGHLMRLSGWQSEVASIESATNLVYITDIADGPIARWILSSGLTIEEAALIQPEYGPIYVQPPMPDRAFEVAESNWSGVVGDLRISNFKILPQTSTDLANITISRGYCSFFSCQFPSPDAPRVLIQFDVETVSPLELLASRPYGATLRAVLGESASYAPNEFGFYLSDDETRLFLDHSTEPDSQSSSPNFVIFDIRPFEPTNRMTVIADMLLNDQLPHEAIGLNFDVMTIPEPCAAGSIYLVGLMICASRRRVVERKRFLHARSYRCARKYYV